MNTTLIELAQQAGEALKAKGMIAATAESCTGGGVAQAITEIAGSTEWFELRLRHLFQFVQDRDAGRARRR
jgi:nicotinamide mononucleotide (NMN) deamidase PncC